MSKTYRYSKCCKCGKDKTPNTRSRCKSCTSTKKYYYSVCIRCKATKKESTTPYCTNCNRKYHKAYVKRVIDRDGMIKFVKTIEDRNGYASVNEIFVDLIGFYNQVTGKSDSIDDLPINEQIEFMWNRVKTYSETGKKMSFKS